MRSLMLLFYRIQRYTGGHYFEVFYGFSLDFFYPAFGYIQPVGCFPHRQPVNVPCLQYLLLQWIGQRGDGRLDVPPGPFRFFYLVPQGLLVSVQQFDTALDSISVPAAPTHYGAQGL